jgi:DNA sulfur modification protein DndD
VRLATSEFVNFRILRDVKIDFACDETNIVFLNALNGRGKTSFQQGLYWCLYGQRPPGNIANTISIDESPGAGVLVSVRLVFKMDESEFDSVSVTRSAKVVGNSDVEEFSEFPLVILGQRAGASTPTEPVVNADEWLTDHFPEGLKQFFLFDGESLEKFFERQTKSAIQGAVRAIAGVAALEGIRDKLDTVIAEAKRTRVSGSGTAEAKEVERQAKEQLIKFMKVENSEKFEGPITNLREELLELNDYFDRAGGNQELLERDSALHAKVIKLDENIRTQRNTFNTQLFEDGISYALKGARAAVASEAQVAHKNGELPVRFDEALMTEILKRGACVCGEPVEQGSTRHGHIKQLISDFAEADELGRDLTRVSDFANTLASALPGFFHGLKAQTESIAQLQNLRDEYQGELKVLNSKLAGVDREERETKASRRQFVIDEIPRLVREQTTLEEQLARELANEVRLTSEIAKLQKSSGKNSKTDAMIALAESLKLAAGLAYDGAVNEIRTRLEEAVDRGFSSAVDAGYITQITDDFDVVTLNSSGTKTVLSDGQNMMKAYVFAVALREVIGFGFPLIVDTPFGRLDDFNRQSLVEMVCRIAPNDPKVDANQVVFLMHNAEYSPAVREGFSVTDPKEFFLHWEVKEKESSLGSGIDPKWLEIGSWKGVTS